MFFARAIGLLAAFPVLLNAQTNVHQSCELHVSVRNSSGKAVQARLNLTDTGVFTRTTATDSFGDATFLNLPAADFRLFVRLSDDHETVEDVSTDGPDCQQFEIVRMGGATDSLGSSEVFIGDLNAPKTARRLYSKAVKNLHRQDWRDAENELEQAVRIHPTFARAYDALGVAASENGDLLEAHTAFRDAINLRRNYPEAYLNFARSLMRQGLDEEADRLLNALLSFDSENSTGNSLLAECLFDEQKYTELIALSRRIHLQHLPHHAVVHEYVAEVYKRRGMTEEYQSESAALAAESRIHP